MKINKLYTTLALGSSLAFSAPALAQETGDVTALFAMRTYSSDGGVFMFEQKGLADLEACLQAAWMSSQGIPDIKSGIGVNVTCLRDGRMIGGQSCYKGQCKGVTPQGTKP
jgi:hypothetical protein